MIKKFLDLGYQPLANSYLLKKYLNHKEETFKLEVGFNKKNFLTNNSNATHTHWMVKW